MVDSRLKGWTDPELPENDIKNSKYSFGNIVLGAQQKQARLDEIVEINESNPEFSNFQAKLVAFTSQVLCDHAPSAVVDSWTMVSILLQNQNLSIVNSLLHYIDYRI
jgi:hypothetical protein